jgi:putative tryptophan/tyrosine transport system substrate-binding protein
MGMRRREFIASLGSAAASTWPLGAWAQQPGKIIGFLGAGAATAWAPMVASFEQRLRELGWIDGRTVAIVYRWADGKSDRFGEITTEFVGLKVDVILTAGSAVAAAKRVTSTIPIVFAAAVDPVASGFVDSLARPGGNVTGLSLQSSDIAPKRIEILREAIPGLGRLAVLANAGYPGAARESAAVQEIASKLGLAVSALDIHRADDIAPAIESLKGSPQALYLCTDSLVIANMRNINALAREAHVATMWGAREYARADGFISYGPNEVDQFRLAADYVDKILKGAKPADIPVAQPTKIDLAINLKTAKVLGLTITEAFLLRADEVIE